ncbi:TPA: ThiF family adenylyltransferase [Clostridioides difficile]|nr:ThiF family adenylyltransferase [Clostridioides difficile]HBE9357025.1 ThiF family adenylyltransferase [Clostridioides difficile]
MSYKKVYKIRDGVDLYLNQNELLTIYFMNTRLRKQFKVSKVIVSILESIDGERNINDIHDKLQQDFNCKIDIKDVYSVLDKLIDLNVVVEKANLDENTDLILRYDRQINFFGDFINGKDESIKAQQKLKNSKILIFGCGAIGGDIAIHLAMCGVEEFILYDYDIVEESDISRHMYFKSKYKGMKKIDALEDYLLTINKNIKIKKVDDVLTPNKDIEKLVDEATFVVNTADEPYIGYTSMKISRYCTIKRKAHFIAGGFDAHLASSGELIIPGITPCVDCYAQHFKEVLDGWKPKKHPVIDRHLEIGGLSSMSLFSASYATIEIVKYICGLINPKEYSNTRGEFLFGTMDITYLDVIRDKKCKICGEIEYE